MAMIILCIPPWQTFLTIFRSAGFCEPAGHRSTPFYFRSACKCMLITGILQIDRINIEKECIT